MDFLTEKKLYTILLDIFKNETIIPQYKYGRRKIDYNVQVDYKNGNHAILDFFDNYYYEVPKEKMPDKLNLLIEFDGHYHFISNHKALEDQDNACQWTSEENNTFMIRIPYFVQLDRIMTKKIFNIDKDYGNDFPHGFISKKCILPDRFSIEGENRLLKILSELPKSIGIEIYRSLLDKSKNKPPLHTCSSRLWCNLIKLFDPERNEVMSELHKKYCSELSNLHKTISNRKALEYHQDLLIPFIYEEYSDFLR